MSESYVVCAYRFLHVGVVCVCVCVTGLVNVGEKVERRECHLAQASQS